MTLILLLTGLVMSSCTEDDYYYDDGDYYIEGEWATTYSDDYGAHRAEYYFSSNGLGTYRVVNLNSGLIEESEALRYEYDERYVYIRYTNGDEERFRYHFNSPNRLVFEYNDAYGRYVQEVYRRTSY